MVRSFFTIFFCFILKLMCNKCLVVKTAFCYNIVKLTPGNRKKHLSRDPQLSSVTRNCQIYSIQLDTLNQQFSN